jgi:WD40 repeat protein
MSVTADGTLAVTGLYQGSIEVWDLASDKPQRKFVGEGPHGWEWVLPTVEGVAITPDGRLAISASADRVRQVWDIKAALADSGKEKRKASRTLTGHIDAVWAVGVTDDGRLAVSGSKDKTVKVWDLAAGGEGPNWSRPSERSKGIRIGLPMWPSPPMGGWLFPPRPMAPFGSGIWSREPRWQSLRLKVR